MALANQFSYHLDMKAEVIRVEKYIFFDAVFKFSLQLPTELLIQEATDAGKELILRDFFRVRDF